MFRCATVLFARVRFLLAAVRVRKWERATGSLLHLEADHMGREARTGKCTFTFHDRRRSGPSYPRNVNFNSEGKAQNRNFATHERSVRFLLITRRVNYICFGLKLVFKMYHKMPESLRTWAQSKFMYYIYIDSHFFAIILSSGCWKKITYNKWTVTGNVQYCNLVIFFLPVIPENKQRKLYVILVSIVTGNKTGTLNYLLRSRSWVGLNPSAGKRLFKFISHFHFTLTVKGSCFLFKFFFYAAREQGLFKEGETRSKNEQEVTWSKPQSPRKSPRRLTPHQSQNRPFYLFCPPLPHRSPPHIWNVNPFKFM